jgi:hypothetical protein
LSDLPARSIFPCACFSLNRDHLWQNKARRLSLSPLESGGGTTLTSSSEKWPHFGHWAHRDHLIPSTPGLGSCRVDATMALCPRSALNSIFSPWASCSGFKALQSRSQLPKATEDSWFQRQSLGSPWYLQGPTHNASMPWSVNSISSFLISPSQPTFARRIFFNLWLLMFKAFQSLSRMWNLWTLPLV